MKKRAISFLLALLIALSLLPGLALADGGSERVEEIYAAIAEGIRNWETEIDVCEFDITVDEYYSFYLGVLNSHPEFFYATSECGCMAETYVMCICPVYDPRFDEDDARTVTKAFDDVCYAIVDSIPDGITTEETLLYIHDYIITHCQYDNTLSKHSAYDCLVLGSAVCEGYARAFLYLCQLAKLDVHFIGSEAINHAWNVARVINSSTIPPSLGAYYYIDCTYDDPSNYENLSNCLHHDFLMQKSACYEGHESRKRKDAHKSSDWTDENGVNAYAYYDTDNFYETAGNGWWTKLNRPVQWVGSLMCYAKSNDRSHVFFRNSGSTTETSIKLPTAAGEDGTAYWYLWGQASYYGESFITVASLNGDFYFSTPTQIWKLTTGRQMSLFYTLTAAEQAKGYIYGLRVQGGNLLYDLAQDPFAAPAYTGTLSFAPAMTAALSAGKPLISWNAIPGATQVRVYRRTCTGSTWGGWENVAKVTSGTSWADKSVTPGGKYKYQVKAYVGGAWTDYSNAETVAIPSAPVLKVGTTAISAKLSWNAVAGASKYRVYRRSNESGSWGGWENIAKLGSVTGWTDTTVIPGGKYKYQVKAYVGDAWTDYSNAVSVSIPSPPVMTVSATSGKITVSWNGIAGATQYRVYRRDNKGGTWSGWVTAAKLTSGTGWTDTGVTAGVQYKYRVRAYVGGEWTDYSNAETVKAK